MLEPGSYNFFRAPGEHISMRGWEGRESRKEKEPFECANRTPATGTHFVPLNDDTKILTETETFFTIPNFPTPKPSKIWLKFRSREVSKPKFQSLVKVLGMMIMKAMVVTMRGLMTAVMVMVRRVLIKTFVGRSLLRSSCRPSYLSWGFCSNDDVAPCLLAESCFGSWFCFHIYQNGDVVSFLL